MLTFSPYNSNYLQTLSEVDYTQNKEPNAMMEVLNTGIIQLASPVYFRVTPLIVDDALARGVNLS